VKAAFLAISREHSSENTQFLMLTVVFPNLSYFFPFLYLVYVWQLQALRYGFGELTTENGKPPGYGTSLPFVFDRLCFLTPRSS